MNPYRPSLVFLLALLLLLPGLVFIGLRSSLPGDPSNPLVDFKRAVPGGLIVQPLTPAPQGLQKGDIVTAIQGRIMDEYINSLFSLHRPVESTNRIEYAILRDERMLQVEVPMAPLTLSRMFKENWSIYIYVIYLELVSLLVFVLRPRLPAAQLFFVVSTLILSSALIYFPGLKADDLLYRGQVILYLWGAVVVFGFMMAGLVHLSLIFPKRHPLLLQHPKLVSGIYLGVWLPFALYLAVRWQTFNSPTERLVLTIQGTTIISILYFPLLLLTTYSSYRTGNEQEKRQVRWLTWSLMISLVPYLVFTVIPSLFGLDFQLPNSLVGILWCTVPTSFAIAVLHERLFDIDVIIRRTLIYSILTVTLGAVYFASILLMQGIFQGFTGQQQPPLAIVLSTMVMAALFSPLRRRVQNDIDRRFYRRKYDAEKMLNEFGLTVRNEVELENITRRLLDVVEETMEPQNVSIWIRKL